MNATMPLLLVSTVATAFAPRGVAQETRQPKVSPRSPVDVSVEGLGAAARGAPGDAACAGGLGLTIGPAMPLACARGIRDPLTGVCLTASSTPTSGVLLPYPGIENEFAPPAFVGGGEQNRATEPWSTVAGGRYNVASGAGFYPGYATVGGGRSNEATAPWSTVGGGQLNTASGPRAVVSGGRNNSASKYGATVGGGRFNTASGDMAVVAGGATNGATAYAAAVGGGRFNGATANNATVAGGSSNGATAPFATVAGGRANRASRYGATVGGGGGGGLYVVGNLASGLYSTIPGGWENSASGDYSFAAGRRATAEHDGAFVWGDSQLTSEKSSSHMDEFSVYCSGGARFFTNSAATTGVLLAPGSSTWTMVSDRAAKENIEPVDARAILDKVAQLPLSTWNYKEQDDSILHMGPMAQDFYEAFGLGLGGKTIDTIDPNGVALAAIQGLNELVKEKDAEIADGKTEIEELRTANEALLARVERLEAVMQLAVAKWARGKVADVDAAGPRRTVPVSYAKAIHRAR